jgi:hypothetical protein
VPDLPVSSFVGIDSSPLGAGLQQILYADDLLPGDAPDYQLCKSLWLYHPLGGRMAESPIKLAQSQDREISVPDGPEEALVEAFSDMWKELDASNVILNTVTQARVYGVSSVAMLTEGQNSKEPVDFKNFYKKPVSFNVFDPLNTSGSIVMDQDPNSPFFQKHRDIRVAGQVYHRSRTCTVMNGPSVYIAWTTSSFGYVGRSVYQRGFYPLKSFLQSMITDDMVTRKAGVLVAKMHQPGSIVNRAMQAMFGHKRYLLKESRTDNVISIATDEMIETLNMQNIDGAYGMARNNILKNIATAEDMPAKLLTQDAFVEGFGEGTQDAYEIASWIDRFRIDMGDIYGYFDGVVQRRAWNPEFYLTIQKRFPEEYGDRSYEDAFSTWRKSFKAVWPALIREPPSEKVQVDDVKLKGVIASVQVLAPLLDPDNQARLLDWAAANLNTHEELFTGSKLMLDMDGLRDHLEKMTEQQEQSLEETENAKPERPFSAHDSLTRIESIQHWLNDRGEMPKRRAHI